MGLLDFINARDMPTMASSQVQKAPDVHDANTTETDVRAQPLSDSNVASADPYDSSPPTPVSTKADESGAALPTAAEQAGDGTRPSASNDRRWSFPRQFRLLRKAKRAPPPPPPPPSTVERHGGSAAPAASSDAPARRLKKPSTSSADRRAKRSALVVRALIVGRDTDRGGLAPPQARISGARLRNVKAQLLEPKTAGKILAQLRALPALPDSASRASEPIQAVCLPYRDEEADEKLLAALRDMKQKQPRTAAVRPQGPPPHHPSSSAVAAVTEALRNLQIVSLFTAPDLGLGQPGDGSGVLAGAVPTAETVINGIEQITPQVMALGYAMGQAVVPDHKGICPPTDRISILTYWWGLELLLPPPTLEYLSRVQSISGTIMNFLTALSVVYEGVREILPFVRYFSQFLEFEFTAIKAQDRGKGVICSATWLMPAAMVPRPWDFPDPPKTSAFHAGATSPPVKAPGNALVASQTAPESPPSTIPATHNPAPVDPILVISST
ncbi:hypothetical protein F5148DRAFT_937532 [Russula earlei]|uniref:Uncharacterized protein n=1 Tax=Russula earlei TaxID=71964 RepID=A0ACC0U9C3_9AGAM|nr:hypothetical protein F5148DRAFT_937532 [Russula earlei]